MAVYNCRGEAGFQGKGKPVGSGRVRAFVQQKERLLPINLGLYFRVLDYHFPQFSLHILSHCRHKKKKNLQKAGCDVFLAALESLWHQMWVLLDRSEEGSAACPPAGEGEKKVI